MNPVIPFIRNYKSGNFFLIAGPCVIEGEQITFDIAMKLKEITDRLEIPFIFKASYKKANRSRSDSFTGIGNETAFEILAKIKDKLQVSLLTDIHESSDAEIAAKYVDVLQIPAFLCRQTDLLLAAGRTGKAVNIKKGQFLSPQAMEFALNKVRDTGNNNLMLTERGTMHGYQDIIVDYRSIPVMKNFGVPVVLDCTHSLQQPNQSSGVTGGLPQLIDIIASAGIAAGADGIFIETHPNPSKAKSDGANMLALDKIKALLTKLIKIQQAIKE